MGLLTACKRCFAVQVLAKYLGMWKLHIGIERESFAAFVPDKVK